MAEEDKNKEKENAELSPSAAPQALRLGVLNTPEEDFIRPLMPLGSGAAASILAGITGGAYQSNMLASAQEFIGVVMRVVPQPYSLTSKLGPYFKILAHEAQKQGAEFALQIAQQLVLVQVRVPELDSMIPDPPIYDENLQLSNKVPDQLTEEDKASIELIERHTTFVGWGAEGGTIPPVGSYVRVAYDNVNNRTGGRYLGIVMSPDGNIPSIGKLAAEAFGACNGDLADHPTGIPRGSFSGVVPVTPAATEKQKLEKKIARLKRKIEGKDTAGNVVEPPLEQATKDKLAERVKEVEAELAALPPAKDAGEIKPDPPPPPPPQNNCVQLMNAMGSMSPGSTIPGSNIYLPPQAVRPPTTDPGARIKEAAAAIGIPEAVLMAIKKIESGGNKPEAVRFEPHVFLRDYHSEWRGTGKIPFTKGVRKSGEVVNWSLTKSETNRAALLHAFSHDPEAAIKSTSFGLFQVMGKAFFEGEFGFATGQQALSAFDTDPEGISYRLLKHWFAGSSKALAAAKALDWAELARRYNGPGQVDKYAPKLHKAYEQYTT